MGKHETIRPPFAPKALAERWGCSDETVRQMAINGRLRFFRVGNMIRIPADAAMEYESCKNTASDASTDVGSSHGTTVAQGEGFVLVHSQRRKPRQKPSI